jgi:hypothetical protein
VTETALRSIWVEKPRFDAPDWQFGVQEKKGVLVVRRKVGKMN